MQRRKLHLFAERTPAHREAYRILVDLARRPYPFALAPVETRYLNRAPSDIRPSVVHYLLGFVAVAPLWLLLAGSLREDEGIAAVAAVVFVTAVAGPRLRIFAGLRFSPMAPVSLIR